MAEPRTASMVRASEFTFGSCRPKIVYRSEAARTRVVREAAGANADLTDNESAFAEAVARLRLLGGARSRGSHFSYSE